MDELAEAKNKIRDLTFELQMKERDLSEKQKLQERITEMQQALDKQNRFNADLAMRLADQKSENKQTFL
jgi:hypothetical protein